MAKLNRCIVILIAVMIFGYSATGVSAQTSPSALYIPLIGITSVPTPLALPNGPGNVTYRYAVKNFIREVALGDVEVVDDSCSPVRFTEGDDNNNSLLDADETWRYECTRTVSTTTHSTATARGAAYGISTMHRAFATVVVGSATPPPLVSIVNITKVAFPLSLPVGGGEIVFTYRVNNPGIVPLSNVTVTDDKCGNMSGRLGDRNGNNLLDTTEVWVYTCATALTETTTNTARVTSFANGLRADGEVTITVQVAISGSTPEFPAQPLPSFPETGGLSNSKMIIWGVLAVILAALISYLLIRKGKKA